MVTPVPEATRQWWFSESGPVELISGWGYLLLAASLLATAAVRLARRQRDACGTTDIARAKRRLVSDRVIHPVLLGSCAAVLAAREFDWHNCWTAESVLKTRFFVDPGVAVEEKLAATAVLVLIGMLVATTIRSTGARFLAHLRAEQPVAWLTATAFVLLCSSKVLDSSVSLFRRHIADVSATVAQHIGTVEEISELAIPVLLLLAASAGLRLTPQPGENANPDRSAACGNEPLPMQKAA